MGEGGAHLEGVVQHENDFVVVVVDRHLQVQAVKLAQVSAGRDCVARQSVDQTNQQRSSMSRYSVIYGSYIVASPC